MHSGDQVNIHPMNGAISFVIIVPADFAFVIEYVVCLQNHNYKYDSSQIVGISKKSDAELTR